MSVSIPSSFTFGVDLGLDVSGIPTGYTFGITEIPKIQLGLDPLTIEPMDFSFRIKEIPSVRVHFPMDYKVCFGLFGAEVASVRLCGQGQIITEPYVPNPCECRGASVVVGREAAAPLAGSAG